MENTIKNFFELAILIILLGLSIILKAYVLSVLWGWFIVPLFNLPAIGIAYSIGLILVAMPLCPTYRLKSSDSNGAADFIGNSIFLIIILIIGWIAKSFI